MTPEERADQFINEEKQFQLGFLITEQSHPKTRGLSAALAEETLKGLQMLYSVDDDIPPVLEKILASTEFACLASSMKRSLQSGGRIIFSGCGATGRLAILLDAANRRFWSNTFRAHPELKDTCAHWAKSTGAVMTGGDYALVKSVESFEDYIPFGYRQMKEMNLTERDTVTAISEGGETSSVIGTIHAGLDAGASVHFLFNNPVPLLTAHIERSRRVIEDPNVNVLDLTTGPMGIAGSTRMQATTIEMLVAGSAFEKGLYETLKENLSPADFTKLEIADISPEKTAALFTELLAQLKTPQNLKTAADYVDFEAEIYGQGGRVTYFADAVLLDIFTDTTERSPTFKIPPFRACDDPHSAAPWAFVKDPMHDSVSAWQTILFHTPNCLSWKPEEYRSMNAAESIASNPPHIGVEELYKFRIGNEPDPSRTEVDPNAAVALLVGDEIPQHTEEPADRWRKEFNSQTSEFKSKAILAIGSNPPAASSIPAWFVNVSLPKTPLNLFGHLAPKLVLNNISSATMGKLGRLSSNWMAHVAASNKKLIDRSIRLVSELAEVDYRTAAIEFFKTVDELAALPPGSGDTLSPAARAVEKFRR